MTIISHVCAEFHDRRGQVLYRLTPADLRRIIYDAPDSIRLDPLFTMLVNDGSLEYIDTDAKKKKAEQDPSMGHDATGKALIPRSADDPTAPEATAGAGETHAKSTRKTAASVKPTETKPSETKPTAEQKPAEVKPADPGTTAAPAKAD